jgi:hypothetical protein
VEPARKRHLVAGGLLLAALSLPLASSNVRQRLAGAWRGFENPSTSESSRTSSVSEGDESTIEGADLRGDFEVVDPLSMPSLSIEGVVPTLSDLPIPLTRRTLRYVNHYTSDAKGRETLTARLKRAERYRGFIERSLRDADLPEDLLFLAAVESGFNPQASSPKGAAGMFQFMPETAERFGLSISSERDERRSIPRSTEAALSYLKILHERFGTWDLALAAYNCGEGRVDRAISEARAKLERDKDARVAFHELAELQLLPKETRDFVPHIHAFAIVFHNRDLLGYADVAKDEPQPFAEIAVPPKTRLATIAKGAGISLSTFREYNPDLLSDRTPGGKSDALVSVPVEELARTLASLPAFIARDEADSSARPAPDKVAKTGRKRASKADKAEKASAESGPEPGAKTASATKPEVALPVPGAPGSYLLPNGVLVRFENTPTADVELSANVGLLDPYKNRAPFGDMLSLPSRSTPKTQLRVALDKAAGEVNGLVYDRALPKLRARLAEKRSKLFEKTGFGPAFASLSDHVFPKGHPLAGARLVGPTEPADDMFLEPEPLWALDVTVDVRGPVEGDASIAEVAQAFSRVLVPAKLPALSASGNVALGPTSKHLLVGWASGPASDRDETATALAFVLACHNKLGRLHRTLRHDKTVATYVNCGLESSGLANVAWLLASPSLPYTTAEADRMVDKAIQSFVDDGPTDAELVAAKGLLRSELARELSTATLRGLPKSRVQAKTDAILGRLGGVGKSDVTAAAKVLFDKRRRFSVTSGG